MFSYVLLFLILLIIPLFNYFGTLYIRAENTSISKEKGYFQIYILYWVLFILVALNSPISKVMVQPEVSLSTSLTLLTWALAIYLFLTSILPLVLLNISSFRETVRANYDEKLYPVSGKQQFMFVFVAITVGICEEIIYRGFINQFVIEQLNAGVVWSCIVTSAIFGISHFMQGIRGIINSLLFGLLMGFLVIWSGSLLLPIVIHVFYDLKPIIITRALQRKLPT